MEENKPIHNKEGKSPPPTDDSPQQEPQLNNPSTDETILQAETNIEAEQHSTLNLSTEALAKVDSKPSTVKDMEVHHHSHESHGKKNWKSYFWEFLMLFLAVFCGFLAEYQLEHMIERDREKKFIQTFVEDLKVDTATINANIIFRTTKGKQLDSLIDLLSTQKIKGYENELYYLGRTLVRTNRFQSSDRTITQLKYSGSLRLIRNEPAADSIIAYQKFVDLILVNQDDDRIERRSADPLLARIYNPFVFYKMLDAFNNIIKPTDNPPLRTYDIAAQQDLAYCINQLKGSNIILSTRLKMLHEKATNTIAFLQKEYHLE